MSPYISMIFYASHPVVIGPDNLVPNADYPGLLLQKLEKKYKHHFIYINGAIGDVNPPAINPKDVYDRTGGNLKHLEEFTDSILLDLEKMNHKLRKEWIKQNQDHHS